MSLQIDLKNKTVLITGVTSGIGAGVAEMFAKAGAQIAGCSSEDLGSEAAQAFVQKIKEVNQQCLYVKCDVTKQNELENFVMETIAAFGKIDILVSNAGANIFEGAENCTEEQWQYNMNLNLASHWHLAKFCKPYLEKADPGVIIIMTSNHAFETIPGCFPYNVTKTALTGLVRSLAIEWGPKIRTVGLAPGFIDTPGNQKWFNKFPDPEKERKRTIELHPVKRIGTIEEVGAWCVYLSSKYSTFASGTTYLLDGGRSALMQDS